MRNRLQHVFRALRHRDFRLFWIGQWVSATGTWMQTMALSWLVYRMTSSPLALGVLTAARFGPSLLGSPLAGVLTDRLPRRRLVLATQTASVVQATILAVLTVAGVIQVWEVLLLAFAQGVIDTLDMPARQTLQVDLVGIEDLQSAVSLNSSAFNVGRMIGPAVAGLIVAELGEGWCFGLNAASYAAVLGALLMIRPRPFEPEPRRAVSDELVEGLRYAWGEPCVRRILLAIAITSAVGLAYMPLVPVLARDVLNAGARGYGFLLAGVGLGSVAGALLAAARSRTPAQTFALLGQVALGVGLVGLGLTRELNAAVGIMVLVGVAVAVQLSTTNGYLQTTAPPRLRGRVVALYTWLFAGLSPLGSLPAGYLAELVGAPPVAIGAGAICLVCAGAVWLESFRRKDPLPCEG